VGSGWCLLAHHWFGAGAELVEFFPRLDQLLGKLLLVALFFLVIGEFCLQGFDFVEYLLVLDMPARNGSFNSHFR